MGGASMTASARETRDRNPRFSQISKNRKLGAVGAAILLVVVCAIAFQYLAIPKPAPANIMIGLGGGGGVSSLPIHIAADTGIFERYGLNTTVVLLGTSPNQMAALAADQIQICPLDLSVVVNAKLQGIDVVMIAEGETMNPLYLVTRPDIDSVQQLKGKIVAVSGVGAGDYLAASMLLRKLGLDPAKDVSFVPIGSDALRLTAVQAGKVDFTLSYETLRAKSLGLRVLLYVGDFVGGVPVGYTVTTKKLQSNRDVLKRFVKAITVAAKFFFENKEGSERIMGKWLSINDTAFLEQLYQDDAKVIQRIPAINLEQAVPLLDAMVPLTPTAANADPRIFVDNSIVDELEAEGFFNSIWT
jgi:NitT/TauT family transport system substrate-binding protein